MELPQEAVNTLSDTAWGAIWLITVFGMGSAITYLIWSVRGNNKTIQDLGEKRTQDAKNFGKMTLEVEKDALNGMNDAKEAVKDLQRSNEDLEKELVEFRREVRERLRALDRRDP